MGSYLLTIEDAAEAVGLARTMLGEAYKLDVVHRPHLHVVILDPRIYPQYPPGDVETAILYEESIPYHRDGWEYPYDMIARSKAEASWHTGRPTDELALLAPHLFEEADVKYYGSVIYRGLIVAASGLKPWYDVAFANAIAGLLVAKAIGKMVTIVTPSENDYLRDIPFD